MNFMYNYIKPQPYSLISKHYSGVEYPPNIDLPNDPFELPYSFLNQYRVDLLNLKSIEQFLDEMN